MAKQKKKGHGGKTIAANKAARHEYFIENTYEAGIVLEGWEVKSLRESRLQMSESYVQLHKGEAWLHGAHISPLLSASTHVTPDATRKRKLLLHGHELARLFAAVERKGYTVVPLIMYWKNNRAKVEIGLGKGKKLHDKRASDKQRTWNREKERLMKA